MKIGYTEQEIGRMYFGKWQDLYREFRWMHNIEMRRQTFLEPKKRVSMLDL